MITKRKINRKREGGLIIGKGDPNFHRTTVSQKDWKEATKKQNAKRGKKAFR